MPPCWCWLAPPWVSIGAIVRCLPAGWNTSCRSRAQALDDLAAGGSEIVSHAPPELPDIRQFRLTVGKQRLPRGGRVATPSRQQQAADGVQVTPAAATDAGHEHVVELDRAAIDQMKREMDLVFEVRNVRRYRLQAARADTARSAAARDGHAVESKPPAVEKVNPTKVDVAETRSAVAVPVERDPASVARSTASDPLTMPPGRGPEPLKIDLAPAIENSPRPLRRVVAECNGVADSAGGAAQFHEHRDPRFVPRADASQDANARELRQSGSRPRTERRLDG